ncbi:hypothetical protein [Actinomadura bangladeshensis]|uniref:Uncharacterized protein n=1 Tax=Actinomadura bangladeshensis TaxID=453573 RepID=A0A4V2XKA8_9ACTN|nr:hypothetical protein [Actinomadura bangladeshensis]TDC05826.1 hypothetical protein E1284_34825 [Actinomadura bangladeshensis]
MPVTDEQVAALHAQLAGRPPEEHLRLFNKLDQSNNAGYAALLAAGLFEAIQRRFVKEGEPADRSEIINFIAAAREKSDDAPDAINPDVAEQMILHALGQGSLSGLDDMTILRHQIILLAALTGMANYSESDLNAFLAQIRVDADEMLG